MIETLTIEKLIAYGFLPEDVENFQQWDQFELMFHKTLNERYWASNIEGKIYSGEDASRKLYFKNQFQFSFPDDQLSLIPEYFILKRNRFLEERQLRAGAVYNEASSKLRFIESEKEWAESQLAKHRKTLQTGTAVEKLVAKKYKENMEVYADWLKLYQEPEIPQPSILKYFKEIPPKDYSQSLIHDEEIMQQYEAVLKKGKAGLDLKTTIYQLPALFNIKLRWDYQLAERLKYAPSIELATEAFREELKDTLVYRSDLEVNDRLNIGRYFNRYRKMTYDFAVKGLALTMRDLGYILLRYQCGRPEGHEIIESVSPVFGVDTMLVVLAEGVAIAEYLHSKNTSKPVSNNPEPVLFKPGHDAQIYLELLKKSDYPILNDRGEYIYGRNRKSAVTAFFDVLDNRGIIYHHSAQKRAPLINKLIPGFNIVERTLDTYPEIYSQMKPYFEKIVDDFLRQD